jgi:methylated-DNA-[protein]-cysteine S-methyltransferase
MNFPASTVYTTMMSPLGMIILSATDIGLSGIWFDGQKNLPNYANWQLSSRNAYLLKAQTSLTTYFAKQTKDLGFAIPLDLHTGTVFQQQVWLALLKIPYGRTVTYSAISQYMGAPTSVRAVAGAVGRNPISIMVPCHRVIGSNGTLTGYAGGLDRKLALLQLEGIAS